MGFSFLPKEFEYFDMFDNLAKLTRESSLYFLEMVQNGIFDDVTVQKMKDYEHSADNVTHDLYNKLNSSFITPFDREDIYTLAHELDGVVDIMLTMVNRMKIYRLNEKNQNLIQFAEVIKSSVDALTQAINGLRDLKKPEKVMNFCIEVNRLENVGDQLRDAVIADLFDNNSDPIYIMKWKEIYQDAETCLDQCEDVANVVSSILVKQA